MSRFLLSLFFICPLFFLQAQVDSLLVQDSVVADFKVDTLTLDFDSANWSVIPEDGLIPEEKLILRSDSGMLLLSAKIGFSDTFDDLNRNGYSISTLPPLAVQLDYFYNDLWSYGGQVVYMRNKCTNDTLSAMYSKNTTFGLAALGTFHYGTWLQDITDNWFKFGYLDLYASLALRMDVHRDVTTEEWNDLTSLFEPALKEKEAYVKMRVRPIFGARYYISDRLSINIELGRGNLGTLTSSVSWLISKP